MKLKQLFDTEIKSPLSDDQFISMLGIKSEEYLLKASEATQNRQRKISFQKQALEFRIPRLQRLVKANPEDQVAFMQLAFAFVQYGTIPINIPKKGQYLQQGIQALRHLIIKKPTNVDARLKLAEAYQEIQDLERLREAYQNVIKIMSPTDPRRGDVERKLLFLRQ